VPGGEYTHISFIHGLDEIVNVDGGLPNTTTNINMFWPDPLGEGYHYMKLEGRFNYNNSGEFRNFNAHTGPTFGNQNYIEFTLPFNNNLSMNGDDWSVTLKQDLAEWFKNPNSIDFGIYGQSIMDRQDVQLLLKENGATVYQIGPVEKL